MIDNVHSVLQFPSMVPAASLSDTHLPFCCAACLQSLSSIFSHSPCCAPLLAVRLSTHGTDPSSSVPHSAALNWHWLCTQSYRGRSEALAKAHHHQTQYVGYEMRSADVEAEKEKCINISQQAQHPKGSNTLHWIHQSCGSINVVLMWFTMVAVHHSCRRNHNTTPS